MFKEFIARVKQEQEDETNERNENTEVMGDTIQ